MMNRLILTTLLVAACGSRSSNRSIILGTLEDRPGVHPGENDGRGIRPLFYKQGERWMVYPVCQDPDCIKLITARYPQEVRWTIGFHGRQIGQVSAQAPNDSEFYLQAGLQQVQTITLSSAAKDGPAWLSQGSSRAVHPPLVAHSRGYVSDPDQWRASQAPDDIVTVLRRESHLYLHNLCTTVTRDKAPRVLSTYQYELVNIGEAYTSKSGWWLIRRHLEDAFSCSDREAAYKIDDPWLVVTPQQTVKELGFGMRLVDAGDYDNDGRAEILFSLQYPSYGSLYRGGYRLWYDDFKNYAEFGYQYGPGIAGQNANQ